MAVFAIAALIAFLVAKPSPAVNGPAHPARATHAAVTRAPQSDAAKRVSACKAAMRADFDRAARGEDTSKRPAACVGIDDATLQRLAGEIAAEKLFDTP